MENSTKYKEVQESHELMKEHMRQRAEKRKLLNQQEEEGGQKDEQQNAPVAT